MNDRENAGGGGASRAPVPRPYDCDLAALPEAVLVDLAEWIEAEWLRLDDEGNAAGAAVAEARRDAVLDAVQGRDCITGRGLGMRIMLHFENSPQGASPDDWQRFQPILANVAKVCDMAPAHGSSRVADAVERWFASHRDADDWPDEEADPGGWAAARQQHDDAMEAVAATPCETVRDAYAKALALIVCARKNLGSI